MLSKRDRYLPHTYLAVFSLSSVGSVGCLLILASKLSTKYAVDFKKFDVYAESCVTLNRLDTWMDGWVDSIPMHRASSNWKLKRNYYTRAKKFDAFLSWSYAWWMVCVLVQCLMHSMQHHTHWLENCHVWFRFFILNSLLSCHVMCWSI